MTNLEFPFLPIKIGLLYSLPISQQQPFHRFSMYPSSSSSTTSQKSMASGGSGLTRYGSAPSSFLTAAVESVVGRGAGERDFSPLGSNYSMAGHFFSGDSSAPTSESTAKLLNNSSNNASGGSGLQRSYGFNNGDFSKSNKLGETSTSLVRQRSSPAGFFSHLANDSAGGFSVTRGPGVSRLNPQLSFTRQDSLSQISQVSENVLDGVSSENAHQMATHSYANATYGIDSWDNTNSIVFSAPPSKRAKNMDGEFLNYTSLESQFSLPQTSLEMATVEKLLQIPEDSVPCKIRAKRGCATHPRSIAERERRTRISGKLKKLQDLVPNMDKQTSYSDMLDLAVQHIKGLQNQVQNLHKDLEDCTCGCKEST